MVSSSRIWPRRPHEFDGLPRASGHRSCNRSETRLKTWHAARGFALVKPVSPDYQARLRLWERHRPRVRGAAEGFKNKEPDSILLPTMRILQVSANSCRI